MPTKLFPLNAIREVMKKVLSNDGKKFLSVLKKHHVPYSQFPKMWLKENIKWLFSSNFSEFLSEKWKSIWFFPCYLMDVYQEEDKLPQNFDHPSAFSCAGQLPDTLFELFSCCERSRNCFPVGCPLSNWFPLIPTMV